MKKLIALLLALSMVACLFAGCSKDNAETTTEAPEGRRYHHGRSGRIRRNRYPRLPRVRSTT